VLENKKFFNINIQQSNLNQRSKDATWLFNIKKLTRIIGDDSS